jgi:hypothetical protein
VTQVIRFQKTLASDTVGKDFDRKKSVQENPGKLDSQSYEYSYSGTDDAVAGIETYTNPPPTDPEQAKELAGGQTDNYNLLKVSPANPKVSETGREDNEFPVKPKQTATSYRSNSTGKSKSTGAPQDKTYAGVDKRQPQSPRVVAAKQQTLETRISRSLGYWPEYRAQILTSNGSHDECRTHLH